MSVRSATVRVPAASPVETMQRASATESSQSARNAPFPVLTSRRSASVPSAIFLDMIDATISGSEEVVAVTSRSAYSFLSTGQMAGIGEMITTPISESCFRISSMESSVRNPGIDSSLSSVPPVCPNPRPDIIGTHSPSEAARGASASETLSPTPPVECLSTTGRVWKEQSNVAPLSVIAWRRCPVSASVIPRMYTAISHAEAW
mmetsp:Transcript_1057/g.2601  ORF Transcript_1057/g.2601 Transcript_1057/m.2601 type:complete len:204 (-) Transcript_1057:154-765(-)